MCRTRFWQRSVASHSANGQRHIPVIPSRTTFRCITLRERAASHSRYSFADNVPLHHTPRMGFVSLSLSVCGQRSVASHSANGLCIIIFIGLRATFRCITLRERAASHSRYSFAANVPLHHTPRTGRVAFPLFLRGQRSVASRSANGQRHIPAIGSRATFRCITLRVRALYHYLYRFADVVFLNVLRCIAFRREGGSFQTAALAACLFMSLRLPKYGAVGAVHRRGRVGDLRSGGMARFACRPNGAEINCVRKLIVSRAAVTAVSRLLLPASAVYPSSFSRIYSAEFAQARLSARRPCRGDKQQAAKRGRRQYTLPPAAGSSRSYIIWS